MESSLLSMLRRCSRLQQSQVQMCRPFCTPSVQLRRAVDSICASTSRTDRTPCHLVHPPSLHHNPTVDRYLPHRATHLPIEPSTSLPVLRQWLQRDRAPFAALNTDPVVMGHFPAVLHHAKPDPMVNRYVQPRQCDGYGPWATDVRTTASSSSLSPWCPVGSHRSLPAPRSPSV